MKLVLKVSKLKEIQMKAKVAMMSNKSKKSENVMSKVIGKGMAKNAMQIASGKKPMPVGGLKAGGKVKGKC